MIRLLTGVLVGSAWLLILYLQSALLLWSVVALVTFLGLKEYYTICLDKQEQFMLPIAITSGLFPLIFVYSQNVSHMMAGLILALIFQAIFIIFKYQSIENPFLLNAKISFGTLYVGICGAHVFLISTLPNGWFWLLLLSIIICSSDTGAYYAGSNFGKRKLCPSVSPGKTVEGFVAGLGSAVLAAILTVFYAIPEPELLPVIVLALCLATLGVVGDLTESIFKRINHIKDSGLILPGHGGVLDRVDSLLITAPVMFYIIYLNRFLNFHP